MSFRESHDSLIFDLDGTIWEATHVVAQAWSKALRSVGDSRLISDNDIRSVTGKPQRECVKILFPDLQGEVFDDRYELLDRFERAEFEKMGGKLYPKVEEGLRRLSESYKIFLVSNCQDWYLKSFFHHSGLQKYFLDSLCFGDNDKPKNENIVIIQERNQLKRPIYIGDTVSDQKACEKAEVDFFFAAYGFSIYGVVDVENYIGKAQSFSDVVEQLSR